MKPYRYIFKRSKLLFIVIYLDQFKCSEKEHWKLTDRESELGEGKLQIEQHSSGSSFELEGLLDV